MIPQACGVARQKKKKKNRKERKRRGRDGSGAGREKRIIMLISREKDNFEL